jgi:endonuclease III
MAQAFRRVPLRRALAALATRHGPPRPSPAKGPFELILWENVAYLAADERRLAAFRALKSRVGTTPRALAGAADELLHAIASAGIMAGGQVRKLRMSAELALREFGGDLEPVLRRGFEEARKALARFPAIGEPGAEKILLLTRSHPVLALDSNGLRVLLRLGVGDEKKSYSASYRSAQQAAMAELGKGYAELIGAHLLLRRHGQATCKRSRPRCEECPLAGGCEYFRRGRR